MCKIAPWVLQPRPPAVFHGHFVASRTALRAVYRHFVSDLHPPPTQSKNRSAVTLRGPCKEVYLQKLG